MSKAVALIVVLLPVVAVGAGFTAIGSGTDIQITNVYNELYYAL